MYLWWVGSCYGNKQGKITACYLFRIFSDGGWGTESWKWLISRWLCGPERIWAVWNESEDSGWRPTASSDSCPDSHGTDAEPINLFCWARFSVWDSSFLVIFHVDLQRTLPGNSPSRSTSRHCCHPHVKLDVIRIVPQECYCRNNRGDLSDEHRS